MQRVQLTMIGLLVSAMLLTIVPRAHADLFDTVSSSSWSSDRGNCDSGNCDSGDCDCDWLWVRGEYLLWQTSGMKLPPLVTGNPLGTPAVEAGVIGVPSTRILLGDEAILDGSRSGYRLSGGVRLCDQVGFEADYFRLQDESANYHFSGGNQIIGRPFINLGPLVPPVRWDTQLIDFPPNLTGHVNVHAYSEFYGAGGRLRFNLCETDRCVYDVCCDQGCDGGCASCCDATVGCAPRTVRYSSLDLTLGYRYLNLNEGIHIGEHVVSASDEFDVHDWFDARSKFNGLELGIVYECCHDWYSFDAFGRVGVGANQNSVGINGVTAIDGVVQADPGGILAQASNIGTHDQTVASLMAQLGFNVNVCLTHHLSANAGYSFLYWGNVARAGEQIDKHVHPGLFPPYTAVPGTIGALPTHKLSDYYAHGLNFGLTYAL